MEDTEMDPNSQPEGEEKDIEDDCLFDDDLFHSLPNISLNLCVDQDSDDDNPLSNSDLQSNESVVTPENDEITY
ncbi:hypothetical protein M9458_023417, partial [Cirrhinus mrigala]